MGWRLQMVCVNVGRHTQKTWLRKYTLSFVFLMLMSHVSRQVDTNSKNVFGQPRLRASLRDLRSPRRTYKSTIEDDLKKLIIMDNPGEVPQRDPVRKRLVDHHVGLQLTVVLSWTCTHTALISLTFLPIVSQTNSAAHLFRWVTVQRAQRRQLRQLWEPDDSYWRTVHLHTAHTQTRCLLQPYAEQEGCVYNNCCHFAFRQVDKTYASSVESSLPTLRYWVY